MSGLFERARFSQKPASTRRRWKALIVLDTWPEASIADRTVAKANNVYVTVTHRSFHENSPNGRSYSQSPWFCSLAERSVDQLNSHVHHGRHVIRWQQIE
jgi:hypothetical protein